MGFLLKIGETFAGGKVEKEVGESNSSEVYLVSHPDRGHLAIKVFKRIEQDPDQLKPLLDKAKIQQQFRHKNIVRIYDAGINEHHLGDLGCIAMEYFPGGSLATLLDSRRANQGKRLSARKTVEIIEQICNGLSAFHSAGHVHGDIKPENILVDLVNKRTDEVRYCVADFGLGKAGDPTTEFYQPPERFREERTDSFASDVWAVGVICYQLLTLEFPFRVKEFLPQGRDPFDEGLKPASGINRSVNPSLDEIIAKALRADSDQRYQTATELLAALGQWRHSLPGTERYRVMEKDDGGYWELGHGAMGITYKAYDTRIGRYVALKVIKEASLASESARERFLREAQLAGRLRHPNVAIVHDFGSYFYVSELIDGHTVDEHVRKNGPIQPVEALEIALQVARALSAAARMSLIHRDLKPANIMLEVDDEGKQVVKVIDFGLAKSLSVTEEESGTMGLTAGFVGTPQYASPEQVKNREMDIRSDIYSLGVTIYFMLTGRPPFRGELFEIFKQIVETPVPPEPLKDSPPQVIALVQRLMAKDPGERPETPKILVDEIQACIREIAKLGPIKLEAGEILAQKYRLIEETEPGPAVRKFLVEDLQTSRRVNILILSPEFLSKSDGLNTLKGLVEKLKKALHSLLRGIYSVEEFSGVSFLVEEYVVGPLLQELLRTRGTLSPPEVTKLLTSLAGLADHATKNGLQEVELTIATVQLATSDRDQHDGRPDMLRVPLTEQESLNLKVGVTDKILQLCGAKSYAQAATIVAGVSETVVDAAPPVSHLSQLSLLGYELLGGRANLIDPSRRPPPIAALTEAANQVLRDGIKGEFSSATEMAEKLDRCVKEMGVVPKPGPGPPPQPQPAPPPPARLVKPPRRLARWMVVALLLSIVVGAAIYYFGPQLQGTVKPVVEAKRYLDKEEFSKALPLLQKAAGSGDADAMNLLGTLYENGKGVTHDYGKAREWFQKAADRGNSDAMNNLGELYYYGRGVVQNFGTALDWYQKAATAGNVAAMTSVGELYHLGQGVGQDDAKALEWYQRAAAGGSAPAMYDLGWLYLKGKGIGQDYSKARDWFENAATAGNVPAMNGLGWLYENGKGVDQNYGTARQWYQKAADGGDPTGMSNLGELYYYGRGVEQNYGTARDWFEKAAAGGNGNAMCYLGEFHKNGTGVAQDYEAAREWYQKAAGIGNAPAMDRLGDLYAEGGPGLIKDDEKARYWYEKAAEAGDAWGMYDLAKLYEKGQGYRMAFDWYQKAAAAGNASAMHSLGLLYENGKGVTQDYGKAREWYQKAADAGNTAAKEALTRLPLLVPDNYASIQVAINAAMPGGTVRVRAGRYNEALRFKEGITLEGEGREGTVIHFAGPPTGVIGQSHYQAPLEVRNCRSGTVRKLTFLQDQSDARANDVNAFKIDAVAIFDSSVTIEECQVTSSASYGIGVYGSRSAPKILRNQCRSNARDGI